MSCATFTEFEVYFCVDKKEKTMADALVCRKFLLSIEYYAPHVVQQQRPTRRSSFVFGDVFGNEYFP